MSKFLSEKLSALAPYTPGEQPQDRKYIKLNTNESPFPPSQKAIERAREEAERLMLYSDPTLKSLIEALAKEYGVKEECVIATNGSDEVLNFAFMAYCEREGAVFPDITYGFYEVFAQINGVKSEIIPLKDDFTIDVEGLKRAKGTIFLANPNAPTGIALPLSTVEEIVASNKERVVVVDEAYIDFGGESAISLIDKYDNLLVTQTFSKSRSMAGARLGMGFASPSIINDLNRIRYSTNPYNVNKMTMSAGVGALEDREYFIKNCNTVIKNRDNFTKKLKEMGFEVTPSVANFVFAKSDKISGEDLYKRLKERGILVRHFTKERIKDYNRITIGSEEDMNALATAIKEILEK